MKLFVQATLDYDLAETSNLLLQIEAAQSPGQAVAEARLTLSDSKHVVRVAGHGAVGERIWLRVLGRLTVDYQAVVHVTRSVADLATLPAVDLHQLPAEVIEYLLPSRYCQSDQFNNFVDAQFPGVSGGELVMVIRDWIEAKFTYVPGSSTSETTALESFVRREGICRDYAHVLISLVRACGIPARFASVYALGVTPQDFHAVAEVFVGGEWQLVDPTGMANSGGMAIIGVGRDAADVSFLTAYGFAELVALTVAVTAL